jgi:AmpD protein
LFTDLGSRTHFSSSIGVIVIIDRVSGWIEGARRVESPNSDDRPLGIEPDLIVVHGISLPPGRFGEGWIDRFFLNELPAAADPYFSTIADLRVSAHALVARDGALTQYVSFNRRAWHAGKSAHCGRTACNDFSVGIELEGTDELPYEPAQYEQLVQVVRALRRAYPSLRSADVVGHHEISPGRKTDPGASFDWPLLRRLLDERGAT